MSPLTAQEIRAAVRAALAEDVGSGDVTTLAVVPAEAKAAARMLTREPLVVAGIEFAVAAFRELSSSLEIEVCARDGQSLDRDSVLMRVTGPVQPLLTAERVALNFVQRLSGVATATASFVEAIRGTPARILDTRKTTPGWRRFEKYAVACGGGTNHRAGLFDMVLIKDNHLAALHDAKPDAITTAVRRARARHAGLQIEVEADTLEQVRQAREAGADMILLDNMGPDELREAVRLVAGRAKTEASGGVTLHTVRLLAETGVNFISVGAITHSARAVDIALDIE